MRYSKCWLFLACFTSMSCSVINKADKQDKSGSQEPSDTSRVNPPEAAPPVVAEKGLGRGGPLAGTKIDYPKLYCESVQKIKLRADASEELALLCNDGAPTELMLQYRRDAIARGDGKFEINIIKEESNNETSEFYAMWSFRVPMKPFDVKSHYIYKYVTMPYASENLEINDKVTEHPFESLDTSGLHLWSADVNYHITLHAARNFPVYSTRKTQYNMYQVLSASEEMGFGFEHLTEPRDDHFMNYKFLNFAFNDGNGYNDGRGGTVVICLLHFKVNNQGFPAFARSALLEIANRSVSNLITVLML